MQEAFANCTRRTGHSCLQVEPQALEVVEGASQIISARPAARGKAMRTREATCEEVKRSSMLLDQVLHALPGENLHIAEFDGTGVSHPSDNK